MQGVICTLPAFSTVSKKETTALEFAPHLYIKTGSFQNGNYHSKRQSFRSFDFGACASAQDDTAKRRAVYLAPRGSARIEHSHAFSACFLRTPHASQFSFTSADSG